jgi:SpoVK/Ycf46/Vps4 family AAA+-type ATPase
MVLLSTNLRNNIDEAFMRRMKYVVDFKIPDIKTRKEIWLDGLSGNVNLENVDFDYLAQKIELSGGYIKNIILNSLFLAAKEGDSINMKHILQSTSNEYLKLGKMVTPGEFERYAYYLM